MYGIFRFNYPGHPGIGLHSGQAHNPHQPGPQHATQGCIRTSDEAIESVINAAKDSPLTTIQVTENNPVSAKAATKRHKHRQSLNGIHHG